jgi:hypothetical protein
MKEKPIYVCEYCDYQNEDKDKVVEHEHMCLNNTDRFSECKVYEYRVEVNVLRCVYDKYITTSCTYDAAKDKASGDIYYLDYLGKSTHKATTDTEIGTPFMHTVYNRLYVVLYTYRSGTTQAYNKIEKYILEWFDKFKENVNKGIHSDSFVG